MNSSRQLGDGTTTQRTSPVQMGGITTAIAAAGGGTHSLVLLSDGTVRAVGGNGYGQLGDGTTTQRAAPVVVTGLTGVAAISAGYSVSGARRADGTVALWGFNSSGQLGDGTTTARPSPIAPTGLPASVGLIAQGDSHTLAVSSTGIVLTWGSNSSSALGDGTAIARTSPDAISGPAYDWNVGTPAFSHATGSFTTTITVTITEATPAAEIHYTLNGDEPTESDPTVASGGTVLIDQTRTLKARAWKSGMPTSRVGSATYTLTASTPAFSPAATTYSTPQTVSMTTSTPGGTIRYTLDDSAPTESSLIYTAPLSIGTTTTIKAATFKTGWDMSPIRTGTYQMAFGPLSAPGTDPAPGTYTSFALVSFASIPGATLRYTTNGATPSSSSTMYTGPLTVTASTTFKVLALHPDYTQSPVTTAAYTIEAAAPAFSPTAGTYAAGQTVAVSTATPGAAITYTLNGSEPVAGDVAIASGESLVAGEFTLKAKAWKSGMNPSPTSTAAYAVTGAVTPAAVAAGRDHSIAIRSDGSAWMWGDIGSRVLPTMMAGVTGATTADGGGSHLLLRRLNGQGLAIGQNSSGQLGDGTLTYRSAAVAISTAASLVSVTASTTHSLAVTADGHVLAWGSNYSQQLGDGTTTSRSTPAVVAGLANVTAVSAGEAFSVALQSDGTVWTWGGNGNGQLGDGTTVTRGTPGQVPLAASIVALASGQRHTLALANDGTVWAWGYNSDGEIGDGTTTERRSPVQLTSLPAIQRIAAGAWHSLAITTAGTVLAWGQNDGRLGNGATAQETSPVSVPGLTSIVGVAGGGSHSLALASDGTVWTWGYNNFGQVGDGTTTARLSPVAISGPGMLWQPATPVIALASGLYFVEQQATVTGFDPAATLRYTTNGSLPTETDAIVLSGAALPIAQSLTLTVRAFKAGAPPSAPVSASYELKAVTPTVSPASGAYGSATSVTIASTTAGANLTYTADTSEPSTGSTSYTGAFTVSQSQTIKARAYRSGWTPSDTAYASYWLTDGTVAAPVIEPAAGTYVDEVVVTMGSATAGATVRYTTDGTEPASTSPIFGLPVVVRETTTVKARAFKPGMTASASVTSVFQLDRAADTATPVLSPTGGEFMTTQSVVVTGPAGATLRYTLTGVDPTATDPVVTSGSSITVPRSLVLKVRAWATGLEPSRVRRADFVITGAIATAYVHGMALKADGTVWTWGSNNPGGLGDGVVSRLVPGQVFTSAKAIATGSGHFLALKTDGTVWGWGSNSGRLGDGSTLSRPLPVQASGLTQVTAIAAGDKHSLALRADGTVWAWGDNLSGALGSNSTTNSLVPVQVIGLNGVSAIGAGQDFSVAVTSDGAGGGIVWTWGRNSDGQLGDGSQSTRLLPVRVHGLPPISRIRVGAEWVLAQSADGRLWAWGAQRGQLPNGLTGHSAVPVAITPATASGAVATGPSHAAYVDTSAQLWAWGANDNVQLGTDGPFSRDFNNPRPAPFTGDWLDVAAGWYSTFMTRADGMVWALGGNLTGVLGDGTTTPRSTPVSVSGLQLVDNTWLTSDVDQDGLPAWREYLRGTDPLQSDTDGDGVPDNLEEARRDVTNPDADGDGVTNWTESDRGTDPCIADTDGDGVHDGLDAFPLDASRSSLPPPTPGDTTPPVITLIEPTTARPVPPEL